MATEMEERRGERRSFYCPNSLWFAMQKEIKDCYSISDFIKKAIAEKLIRDFPENREYFLELSLKETSDK